CWRWLPETQPQRMPSSMDWQTTQTPSPHSSERLVSTTRLRLLTAHLKVGPERTLVPAPMSRPTPAVVGASLVDTQRDDMFHVKHVGNAAVRSQARTRRKE